MRQGPFELVVFRSDGSAIEEYKLDGKNYIAAEPNTEYKVKVTLHCDSQGLLPYPFQLVRLIIDNRYVNYSYGISAPEKNTATFCGFRKDSESVQAFEFSEPSIAGTLAATGDAGSLGSIKMIVNETVLSTTPTSNHYRPVDGPASVGGEGKKFWQQPSLQTAHGRIVSSPITMLPFLHTLLRAVPDASLEIFYHTPDMVKFLRCFHEKDEEQNTLTSRVLAPPVHVDLSTAIALASPVRVPAEVVDLTRSTAKVKLENEGTTRTAKKSRASSSSQCEVVDLTM